MASERDIFSLSGPLHLTHINWKNPDHRRSVAASLVQGAYILERDRQQNRKGPEALANPWWESFNFELIRVLIDDVDSSVFGAIYQLKLPFSGQTCQNYFDSGAPKTVIAFRGNIIKGGSLPRDLKLDLDLLDGSLHRTSRFEIAMQAVRNVFSVTGDLNFWLAGHSLGAAMAMLAGKNMAKQGILLETFLFNPPFFSAPIERIKDQRLKDGIRIAGSLITAGLAVATKNRQENLLEEDSFAALSCWLPCLFVNPADNICMEYVGYFQHRQKMKEIGAGKIERLATKNSIGGLFLSALGREYNPLHLIPSANLTVNFSPSPGFERAHEIHQWWQPDLKLQCQQYHYK